MNHAPFIWSAYAIGLVALTWCAVAPIMRKKSLLHQIRKMIEMEKPSRDANP